MSPRMPSASKSHPHSRRARGRRRARRRTPLSSRRSPASRTPATTRRRQRAQDAPRDRRHHHAEPPACGLLRRPSHLRPRTSSLRPPRHRPSSDREPGTAAPNGGLNPRSGTALRPLCRARYHSLALAKIAALRTLLDTCRLSLSPLSRALGDRRSKAGQTALHGPHTVTACPPVGRLFWPPTRHRTQQPGQ
jgi:hypothetical protein